MNKSELFALINECINESLILKRYQDKLVAASNAEIRADQSRETFKNKDKLKRGGFKWEPSINSWTIDVAQFESAKRVLAAINQVEQFEERIEELPEFLADTDNLSKKEELSQRIDGFLAAMTNEVDAARASEEVKNFMEFQSKLKSRSFHNTLLIYLQNRNATHVEGYRVWQNKFGRQVRKGAKGITIIIPLIKKAESNPVAAAADASTGDDSEVDTAVKTRNTIRFGTGTVFDIKDTDPIPGQEHKYAEQPKWHADDTPSEAADKVFKYATQLATELGVNVTRDVSRRGEMGYSAGDHINITSEIDGVNKAGTLIHEIAHELLHHKDKSVLGGEETLSKEDKEIQAESVSYLVLRHYDLPAKHQATYLTLWKANKDMIHKNLSAIKKAVDFIIDKIDAIAVEDPANNATTGESPTIKTEILNRLETPTYTYNEVYNKLKKIFPPTYKGAVPNIDYARLNGNAWVYVTHGGQEWTKDMSKQENVPIATILQKLAEDLPQLIQYATQYGVSDFTDEFGIKQGMLHVLKRVGINVPKTGEGAETPNKEQKIEVIRNKLNSIYGKDSPAVTINIIAWFVSTYEGQQLLQTLMNSGKMKSDSKEVFKDRLNKVMFVYQIDDINRLSKVFTEEFGIRDGLKKMYGIK